MSKKVSQEEYEKTLSFRLKRWLDGTKDPFLDTVEMKVQAPFSESQDDVERRIRDREVIAGKVYDRENNTGMRLFHRLYKIMSVLFCLFLVAMLLEAVSWLPPVGEADRPVNNEVSARYIESGLQETGATNIVTGMILTYRAFDTFGETNVLFISACCVMVLLMMDEAVLKRQESQNDRKLEPKNDVILQKSAFVLCPVIFIFGIYVILNGQLSPGGGFSGGAILGAGLILYVSAFGFKKPQRFFNEKVYLVAKTTSLVMYGLIGSYFYITGANGIENHIPLGLPGHILSGGIILPIDICVGIEVACTMYAFYALFRRGGL